MLVKIIRILKPDFRKMFFPLQWNFFFQIILEAIPKDETDQARRYRGYIAIGTIHILRNQF